jgi:hypothetical protein
MAKVCKRFDSIAEILPDKETVRIQVRVLKLWKVPAFLNPAETRSIEMVLVDEKVIDWMLINFILWILETLYMLYNVILCNNFPLLNLGWEDPCFH